VLRWHREAYRRFWKTVSQPRAGRPPVAADVIALIRRLSEENVFCGAPRIAAELAMLGHRVADSTVAKYMTPRKKRPPLQTWRTFLANHLGVSARQSPWQDSFVERVMAASGASAPTTSSRSARATCVASSSRTPRTATRRDAISRWGATRRSRERSNAVPDR